MARADEGLCPPYDVDQHAFSAHRRFMQIHLPVHKTPGVEEILDVENAFLFHDQMFLVYIQHRDNAVYANGALLYAGKKTVALEVVKAIDVQLAGDQLMKEFS